LYFGDIKNENEGELNICGKAVQGKKRAERKDDCTTCARDKIYLKEQLD
jgi:hypothetical protein